MKIRGAAEKTEYVHAVANQNASFRVSFHPIEGSFFPAASAGRLELAANSPVLVTVIASTRLLVICFRCTDEIVWDRGPCILQLPSLKAWEEPSWQK